jgi:long-chain acyl-CoA synthetase
MSNLLPEVSTPSPNLLGALSPEAELAVAGRPAERLASFLERSRRLAALLGVEPGRTVLLGAGDPVLFLEGLFATLLADAVAIPIDPHAGRSALASVLDQARPALCLVGNDLEPELRLAMDGAAPLVDLGADPGPGPSLLGPPIRGGDDSAIVIFTSGSTGVPKGVVLTHDNLLASVSAILDYLPIARFPRTGVLLPLHYGYALVGQVLVTLAAGGSVTFLAPLRFPVRILDALVAERVEGISSVPTSLRLLCDAADEDGLELPGIGYVGSAGARLPPELPARLRRVFPRARLFNQYGCTEASPRVSFVDDTDPKFSSGCVGRPIRGLEIAILRPDGTVAETGAEGDIGIRGPNVSPGYLGDPEGAGRGRRGGYLLTGDVGFLDGDGCLNLSGRRDRLVKCGGERVSLDEVEQALRAHASVEDAAAVALEHPVLGAEIVALVVGRSVEREELWRHLRVVLGPAKRPARLRFVEKIPRSSSGKAQKEALLALASPTPEVKDGGEPR